ncbi:hypothetical protein MRX96_027790 [Rhipicephalus microplus]
MRTNTTELYLQWLYKLFHCGLQRNIASTITVLQEKITDRTPPDSQLHSRQILPAVITSGGAVHRRKSIVQLNAQDNAEKWYFVVFKANPFGRDNLWRCGPPAQVHRPAECTRQRRKVGLGCVQDLAGCNDARTSDFRRSPNATSVVFLGCPPGADARRARDQMHRKDGTHFCWSSPLLLASR